MGFAEDLRKALPGDLRVERLLRRDLEISEARLDDLMDAVEVGTGVSDALQRCIDEAYDPKVSQ